MATLSVTFGKELSPQITDIYWDAFKSLAIEQFQAGAKSWIRIGKHFPKPAELLERSREMEQSESKPFVPLPPPDRKWLGLINGMFLKYLSQRRLADEFRGDINVRGRRAECLSLVAHMEALEAEFPEEASEANLKILFDKAMKRIPDLSADDLWLGPELERQRREDKGRDRAQAT